MATDQQTAFSSLADLARDLHCKKFTSVELTGLYLDRIARLDGRLHAYVSVHAEAALLQARAADLQRQSGLPLPPLHGLPIALKDLCDIDGQVTTGGSQAWIDRTSTSTSTVAERLLAAGMIILGKTHMVEFAFGAWGTNPVMGTPRNPWDLTRHHRVPGGSSSGSGVAVAGGLAPAAIGSDTGGSVRVPAAFNGLTGLKTTSGRISLHGTIALSPSMDTIGPMTRTAEDAGLLLAAIAGPDLRDTSTLHHPLFRLAQQPAPSVQGLRIAVMRPDQYPWPVTPAVQAATDDAVRVLRTLGATVTDVTLPFDWADYMRKVGTLIAIEAFHQHAHHIGDDSLPIGPWVRQRTISGGTFDAHAYQALLAQRQQAIVQFDEWMQSYDLLLTPTLPFVACPLTEVNEEVTPLGAFNRAVNFVDACAITLPAGFSDDGLPIGVQLIARAWHESLLLQAGQAFQQATDWHRRRPDGLA
ncbi:MAG: amidase [Herminiimonas sp.]|nr:amidase [Herminiimonas sp.]